MNRNRILIGGIAAGVFLIVCDFVGHGLILQGTYDALRQAGTVAMEPQIPFLPLLMLAELAVGIAIAWLYAAARPRLGAGPQSAVYIAIALIVAHIPGVLARLAWDFYPLGLVATSFLITIVQAVGGTLIAGWLYRE